MKLQKYTLDHRANECLTEALKEGRALSNALARRLESSQGETYTLAPTGVEPDELYNFRQPFKQIDYPISRSEQFQKAFLNFDSVSALVSHFADFVLREPNARLWTEDYLARRGDPILSARRPANDGVKVVYIEDTVTHLQVGKHLLASRRSDRIIKSIRSMSVWNGVFLHGLSVGVTDGITLQAPLLGHMQSEAAIVFVLTYGMDGFVFHRFSPA